MHAVPQGKEREPWFQADGGRAHLAGREQHGGFRVPGSRGGMQHRRVCGSLRNTKHWKILATQREQHGLWKPPKPGSVPVLSLATEFY